MSQIHAVVYLDYNSYSVEDVFNDLDLAKQALAMYGHGYYEIMSFDISQSLPKTQFRSVGVLCGESSPYYAEQHKTHRIHQDIVPCGTGLDNDRYVEIAKEHFAIGMMGSVIGEGFSGQEAVDNMKNNYKQVTGLDW